MTPMVDVVMVILIFFMASATFAGAEWFLRTGLPKEEVAERTLSGDTGDPFKLPPARFEILLSRSEDGRTVVTGQGLEPMLLDDLGGKLRELAAGTGSEDLVLVIRSNADVPYGDVIRAHSEATGAGIGKIGLMDAGG
jgi:biopolymer transport protein ExbD